MKVDLSAIDWQDRGALWHSNDARERYTLRALGVVALPLCAGDAVQVIDPEGLQAANILAFDSTARGCTDKLGLPLQGRGDGIAMLLQRDTPGARRMREKLHALGVALETIDAAQVLRGDTPAGSQADFVCETDAICLIAAPGADMPADQQNPPTELHIYVTRANPAQTQARTPPPPLAEPLHDVTIRAASAHSYTVSAGEYIQVVDIDGRQCSDFQCFDAAKLERGVERCLDATATRTLAAAAYPMPGLYAKFFDCDLEPLVEVVQDTCGRHDSFGLACTAKYYEDKGYPGHANCSDNFNLALRDYPVAPRNGWMAMNLFFNTFFDDAYQLYSDEPWSRPGDFVVLRALKDLVCVSSSCSDDIDAANGWRPTDIQVRVYQAREMFKRAIAYRKTPDSEYVMTKETGFHSETQKLTRDFVEYAGYWLPNSYTAHGAIDEYWACRRDAAVIDLSPLRKYEVVGPDAGALLQHCVTRDIKKLGVGGVVYTAMCNVSGGMIDDGTVFRLDQHNFRWIGGADDSGLHLREQAAELNMQAWVKTATDQLHNLQVQGPKSCDILREIIWTRDDQASVDELAWFRFSIARLGAPDGAALLISRTGYTGELGFEIFCHPKDAPEVWREVMRAGEQHGIKPMGLAALDMLRIEAGLIFAGYEFCAQTDPFEAGIGFCAPQSKTDDFIGKAALAARRANPQRKLVGLELQGNEVAAHADEVYVGRQPVGVVTSAVLSPVLGKNIALARLNVEFAGDGCAVEVGKLDGKQKRIQAKVTKFPHFDPGKRRVRGDYQHA